MVTRMTFMTFAALAFFGWAGLALADGEDKTVAPISQPDEVVFTNAPFSGGVGDGLAESDLTGFEFDFSGSDEGSGKKKYVYKGESDISLRRVIKDDRIDDGYVQGLLRQRGSD